jgi:hypothetical protein
MPKNQAQKALSKDEVNPARILEKSTSSSKLLSKHAFEGNDEDCKAYRIYHSPSQQKH